jgi:hypothetical protein
VPRRIAAFLSLALLAQLSLFGGLGLCGSGPGAAPAQEHVTGHETDDTAPPGHDHETQGPAPCAATSMCAVVMLVADAGTREDQALVHRVRQLPRTARPPSVHRVPELPPPRA